MPAPDVKQALEQALDQKANHNIKYILSETAFAPTPDEYAPDSGSAFRTRLLSADDYAEYETFWRKCHPGGSETGWVKDYFDEMVQAHTCIGLFAHNILASCTDAPGMPYMENEVQEIGINTLPEYRNRGYAAAVCRRCIGEILHSGKAPLWSAAAANQASRRLAEKVGFTQFGEVFSMTL